MKYNLHSFLALSLTVGIMVVGLTGTTHAMARIVVTSEPPRIYQEAPPEVVMVPQTNVYYVPDSSYDIFYYNGFWWSQRGDRWYRSARYNGQWGETDRRQVPDNLTRIPKNYRRVYQGERHIKYQDWNKRPDRNQQNEDQQKNSQRRNDQRGQDRGY